MLNKIELCFDMSGCPNNCGHCWIKTVNKVSVKEKDLRRITEEFKALTDEIGVYTWYQEPDYLPNYKELWDLERELSSKKHDHFELLSDWRILRDDSYLKWAYDVGVRTCQLTFFGMEDTTNKMTGRDNAFNELIEATYKLIEAKIAPRYQLFVYDFNIHEIKEFYDFIKENQIEKKCIDAGIDFKIFAHTGSCIGNAMNLYDTWLTEKNISKIPNSLIESMKSHYKSENIKDILGVTEKSLYEELIKENSIKEIELDSIIFYIDGELDVYPHFVVHKAWWKLGNLKKDSAKVILKRYLDGNTIGQKTRSSVALSEMVKEHGCKNSNRIFHRSDYIEYITEKYLESNFTSD